MKKKKQSYEFGNSNYRKMNPDVTNKKWIHLEKDNKGNLHILTAHPDDIKSCFESKKLKDTLAKNGNKNGTFTDVCTLTYIGKAFTNNVKELFETVDPKSSKYCIIDDFFKVEILPNRRYLGKDLEDDLVLVSITC